MQVLISLCRLMEYLCMSHMADCGGFHDMAEKDVPAKILNYL